MANYLVTGTRVYDPASRDSDLDIVMVNEDLEELELWLRNIGIEITRTPKKESYVGGGFYFVLCNMRINIINGWSQEDMNCWRSATEKMKKLPPIKDREKRLEKFREFYWEKGEDQHVR